MEYDYKYKAFTRSITFNHAPYIGDTMDGFTMQETTFPFVCAIIDDASTDGEQDVIGKYLAENFQTPYRTEETDDYRLICANHKTNRNCSFVVFLLKYNHYNIKKDKLLYLAEWWQNAQYHALCEGDDYWTDPLKLQKQADFLDKKHEFGMVYADCNTYIQSTNTLAPIGDYSGKTSASELLLDNSIATLTVMMRTSVYNHYYEEIDNAVRNTWKMGDYPIWIWFSIRSKIGYINETVATYRILDSSASHNKDLRKQLAFAINAKEISLYFAKRYGYTDLLPRIEQEINKYCALRSLLDLDFRSFIPYYYHSSKISFNNLLGYLKAGVKMKFFHKN